MYFRQLLNDDTACASYLFGCKSKQAFAVADPHVDLVDNYIELAEREGMKIVAVFETHVQADHVSGLPELVERIRQPRSCKSISISISSSSPSRSGSSVGCQERQMIAGGSSSAMWPSRMTSARLLHGGV